MKKNMSPLETQKFYKVKNPTKNFLCALCSAPRSMKYAKNLNHKQIFQILLISGTLSWILFPVMGLESVFTIFLVWPSFEIVNKLLYRKEIACPYCGFDATWYRRDVKKANELVKNFWSTNYPELVSPKIDESSKNSNMSSSEISSEASSQEPVN